MTPRGIRAWSACALALWWLHGSATQGTVLLSTRALNVSADADGLTAEWLVPQLNLSQCTASLRWYSLARLRLYGPAHEGLTAPTQLQITLNDPLDGQRWAERERALYLCDNATATWRLSHTFGCTAEAAATLGPGTSAPQTLIQASVCQHGELALLAPLPREVCQRAPRLCLYCLEGHYGCDCRYTQSSPWLSDATMSACAVLMCTCLTAAALLRRLRPLVVGRRSWLGCRPFPGDGRWRLAVRALATCAGTAFTAARLAGTQNEWLVPNIDGERLAALYIALVVGLALPAVLCQLSRLLCPGSSGAPRPRLFLAATEGWELAQLALVHTVGLPSQLFAHAGLEDVHWLWWLHETLAVAVWSAHATAWWLDHVETSEHKRAPKWTLFDDDDEAGSAGQGRPAQAPQRVAAYLALVASVAHLPVWLSVSLRLPCE